MTVIWTVKVAEEWYENCMSRNSNNDCFHETHKKFGYWIYSASYSSCFWLRNKVEKYLESKGVEISLVTKALGMFCGAMEIEVEYNEQVYEVLREALRNIAETSEDTIIRSHAKALIELITTAEKLKSAIVCSG